MYSKGAFALAPQVVFKLVETAALSDRDPVVTRVLKGDRNTNPCGIKATMNRYQNRLATGIKLWGVLGLKNTQTGIKQWTFWYQISETFCGSRCINAAKNNNALVMSTVNMSNICHLDF